MTESRPPEFPHALALAGRGDVAVYDGPLTARACNCGNANTSESWVTASARSPVTCALPVYAWSMFSEVSQRNNPRPVLAPSLIARISESEPLTSQDESTHRHAARGASELEISGERSHRESVGAPTRFSTNGRARFVSRA